MSRRYDPAVKALNLSDLVNDEGMRNTEMMLKINVFLNTIFSLFWDNYDLFYCHHPSLFDFLLPYQDLRRSWYIIHLLNTM